MLRVKTEYTKVRGLRLKSDPKSACCCDLGQSPTYPKVNVRAGQKFPEVQTSMKLCYFRGLKTGQISKIFEPRARPDTGYDLRFGGKSKKSWALFRFSILLDLLRVKSQKLKKSSLDSLMSVSGHF